MLNRKQMLSRYAKPRRKVPIVNMRLPGLHERNPGKNQRHISIVRDCPDLLLIAFVAG